MPGKKSRLAAAVAVAGACALLAACSPVKVGAAAIVGSDRITSASLDSQVSNLQQSGDASQIPAADLPKAVLGWLISFAVRNQTAHKAGITVSQSDVQNALTSLQQQAEQSAGASVTINQVVAANGVPPDLSTQFGQWYAQLVDFYALKNGGKLPATQAEETKVNDELVTADCKSAKSLGVQVNPQYGQLSYEPSFSIYEVAAGNDLLSRAAGPKPSATKSTLPSC
ncbi:MAG TPA: SurA N-terminal domain-containing protein [Trebonia sp.]|nr:SurA N-terminal domain-containing protein [Trebonia sp.]